MKNPGKIIQDEKGKRYFVPDRAPGVETMPKNLMLRQVDEDGDPVLDESGRAKVKFVGAIELLTAIRERRWSIVGYVD